MEKNIEQYLRDRVREQGGIAYKFTSPGNNGVPDRLILFPGGRAVFVETKAPGKKSRPMQKHQQNRISALGFPVYADIDSKEKVDQLLEEVRQREI
jgi:hypothetical protein